MKNIKLLLSTKWENKELLMAALSYLVSALFGNTVGKKNWPFNKTLFESSGYISDLEKCKIFIDAEIKRIKES